MLPESRKSNFWLLALLLHRSSAKCREELWQVLLGTLLFGGKTLHSLLRDKYF